MAGKELLRQRAQEVLDNCRPKFESCLLWQGAVDSKGYGYIKFEGKRTRVHRLVKLYGKDYSDEQIGNLVGLRLENCCPRGLYFCVEHWTFRPKNDPTYFEPDVELRERLVSAGYI